MIPLRVALYIAGDVRLGCVATDEDYNTKNTYRAARGPPPYVETASVSQARRTKKTKFSRLNLSDAYRHHFVMA